MKDEQHKMARAFLEKYTLPKPNRPFGSFERIQDQKSPLTMDYSESIHYLSSVAETLFREKPRIEQEDFEKGMLERMLQMHSLKRRVDKILVKLNLTGKYRYGDFVGDFFQYRTAKKVPFKDQVKACRLNIGFLQRWLATKPDKIGNAFVHYELGSGIHGEMPLALVIRTHKGTKIATIGGLLDYNEGMPVVRITNIQGISSVRFNSEFEKNKRRSELYSRMYKNLSAELKENWRVHFIKKIVSRATEHGFNVIGNMPRKDSDVSPVRYRSQQVPSYRYAYKKAGLTKTPFTGQLDDPQDAHYESLQKETWTNFPKPQKKVKPHKPRKK